MNKDHLHCFTGTWVIAKKYLETFENLCIGVTPLVTFNANQCATELVQNIPLDRLLLETDAPFFVPRSPDVNVKFYIFLNLVLIAEYVPIYYELIIKRSKSKSK